MLGLLYPVGYNRIIPDEGGKVHGNRYNNQKTAHRQAYKTGVIRRGSWRVGVDSIPLGE